MALLAIRPVAMGLAGGSVASAPARGETESARTGEQTLLDSLRPLLIAAVLSSWATRLPQDSLYSRLTLWVILKHAS
jgi:hypothetical protein